MFLVENPSQCEQVLLLSSQHMTVSIDPDSHGSHYVEG